MTDLSKLLGGSSSLYEDLLRRAYQPLEEPAYIRTMRELERKAMLGISGGSYAQDILYGDPASAARNVAMAALGIDSHRSLVAEAARGILPYDRLMDRLDPLSSAVGYQSALLPRDPYGAAAYGDLQRHAKWAGALEGSAFQRLEELLAPSKRFAADLHMLSSARDQILEVSQRAHQLATMGLNQNNSGMLFTAQMEETRLKLSAFASVTDVLGSTSPSSVATFDALLGRYHTSIDLPPEFWRRREARVEVYREADVDPGLVEADKVDALDVLIESGAVGGLAQPNGRSTALVVLGHFTMRISSRRTRHDAFVLIDALEINLRTYIAAKLEAAAGPQWFKQRVPGDVLGRAKGRREEARRNGEPHASLLQFTDLGDMIAIITRGDNWNEVFEGVFLHQDRLRVDMERMVAIRRPTAHARGIDGIWLVEIVCVAKRLQGMIEQDGGADAAWDDED